MARRRPLKEKRTGRAASQESSGAHDNAKYMYDTIRSPQDHCYVLFLVIIVMCGQFIFRRIKYVQIVVSVAVAATVAPAVETAAGMAVETAVLTGVNIIVMPNTVVVWWHLGFWSQPLFYTITITMMLEGGMELRSLLPTLMPTGPYITFDLWRLRNCKVSHALLPSRAAESKRNSNKAIRDPCPKVRGRLFPSCLWRRIADRLPEFCVALGLIYSRTAAVAV